MTLSITLPPSPGHAEGEGSESDVARLFTALFAHTPEALAEVRVMPRRAPPSRYFGPASCIRDVHELLRRTGQTSSVYHSVCAKMRAGSKEEVAIGYGALVLDHDDRPTAREAWGALADVGLEPSIIVNSGRGFHSYFLLDALAPVEEGKLAGKRLWTWLDDLDHIAGDRVYDAARVLRTPGSWNARSESQCLIAEMAGHRYSLAQVNAALDKAGARMVELKTKRARTGLAPRTPRTPDTNVPVVDPARLELLWSRLDPAMQQRAMTSTNGARHERDFIVAKALIRAGASDDEVVTMASFCDGLKEKLDECGVSYWRGIADDARASLATLYVSDVFDQREVFGEVTTVEATVTRIRIGTRVVVKLDAHGRGEVATGVEYGMFVERVWPLLGWASERDSRGKRIVVTLLEHEAYRQVIGWYAPTA